MNIQVNGKLVALTDADVIGAGGEGTVYRWGAKHAIKWYLHPSFERAQKLQALLANPVPCPKDVVYAPTALAYNDRGEQIGGLAMWRIGPGYEPLKLLANPKHRTAFQITTLQVADLFLNGAGTVKSIHQAGYCIGDFSDKNARYQGKSMIFLDVDAWQFGNYPCAVVTEAFAHPDLYGIDLSRRPVFLPKHDWYSYAVLLYRSLLMVHPFGGNHRLLKNTPERVLRGVLVTDPGVVYPQNGLSPDLISDDLHQVFVQVLKERKLDVFPTQALQTYADHLTHCPSCGSTYPTTRRACPVCSAVSATPVPAISVGGLQADVILKTHGPILFSKLIGQSLYVLAEERGQLVQYRVNGAVQREVLGLHATGTRFELTEDTRVENAPGDARLDLIRKDGMVSLPTSTFLLTGRAPVRASLRYVFRIVAGQLMYGHAPILQYIERAVRPVMAEHTWFAVRQDAHEKPTVAGYMQIGRAQSWWLSYEGRLYDRLPLPSLALDEALTDVLVRFSGHDCLILRATKQAGKEYRYVSLVDERGQVNNFPHTDLTDPLPHGAVYAHGRLLSTTDDGLVQENLATGAIKTFPAKLGTLAEGNTLYPIGTDLYVIKTNAVLRLRLS